MSISLFPAPLSRMFLSEEHEGNNSDEDFKTYTVTQLIDKGKFYASRAKLSKSLLYFEAALMQDANSIEALNGKGILLKQLDRKIESLDCFTRALSIRSNHPQSLLNCGMLYKEMDRLNESLVTLELLVTLEPNALSDDQQYCLQARELLAQIYSDLGSREKFLGNFDRAMKYYSRACTYVKNYAPGYYNIGVLYSEIGKYAEALKYYLISIEGNPFYAESYCNIGVIHKSSGRLDEAINYYQKSLAINPNFLIAKNNMAIALTDMGTALKSSGHVKEGIKLYKKAVTYNSSYADAYYNLGVAYGELRRYDKAILYYELCLHFNPNCSEAYNNLGVIYKDQENLEKAVQCYLAALAINPKFSQTLNNIGVVYTIQGKMDEAFESVQAALRLDQSYAEAYNNLGVLFRDVGDIEQSLACYQMCLQLNPNSRNAGQNRLLAMNYSENLSPSQVYEAHKLFGEFFQKMYTPFSHKKPSKTESSRVLRIGYVSPDFFTHSVSYFIESILMHHDPSTVHVICYSNVMKEDNKTQKLKKLAHEWRDIQHLNAEQAAKLIMNDKIDILVDLAGHTASNRLDVFAMKPAPLQVTYIGYCNTAGLSNIDYRLTDANADPPNTEQKFVEKLVRLPKCFLCYSPSPDVGPECEPPCVKNGFITFGSFNNVAKMNIKVITLWCRVLRKIPNSRMVIKSKPFASSTIRKKYLALFKSLGVESSRIDLITLIPSNRDHLQSYGMMDISLDTFPYSGTTTTCESLYMGVPCVTLTGKVHVQNVTYSILKTIGYDEWIAKTEEEYVNLAVKLAGNFNRLQKLRKEIRRSMENSYLCDGTSFTKNIENAYRVMWQDYLESE